MVDKNHDKKGVHRRLGSTTHNCFIWSCIEVRREEKALSTANYHNFHNQCELDINFVAIMLLAYNDKSNDKSIVHKYTQ